MRWRDESTGDRGSHRAPRPHSEAAVHFALPALLRVRQATARLWIATWLDRQGVLVASVYREVCKEKWQTQLDEDLTRPSDWGCRYYRALQAAWDSDLDAVEPLTGLEVYELPDELLAQLVAGVFDGDWPLGIEVVQ